MFDVLSQLAAAHAENYVQRDRRGRVKKQHHTFEENGKPKELLDLISAHPQATEMLWTSLKIEELWGWDRHVASNNLRRLNQYGYMRCEGKVGYFVAYRFDGEKT